MTLITSTANSQIKQIRKLRDRKERQQTGLFYIEGLRIVGEAIQKKWRIESLVIAPGLLSSSFGQQLKADFREQGGNVIEVTEAVFESIALKENPQGIGAVVHQQWWSLNDISLQDGETWVALDSVADPGNLGTILRTNDASGGKGIILIDNCTDPYDPSSIRGSMGAIFSQKLVKTSFETFREWKKIKQIPVFGTSDKAAEDYHYVDYPKQLIVFMGSERQGLSESHQAICDRMIRIPMLGESDSLNLAVATALIIYEVYNHRRDR